MNAAFVIAAKDLRQRFRDRSALVLGFVAPILVAALMSFAFSSVEAFHADVALVDNDRGQIAVALRTALTGPELSDVLTVKAVEDEAQARKLVDEGEVGAGLVIPKGFSTAAIGDEPVGITVLGSPDNPLQAQVARAVADTYVAQLNADRLSVHAALAAGVPPARTAELARAVADLRLPESVEERPTGYRQLTTASYYAPAMGIMFVLFAIGFTAHSFFTEQRASTLERIGAAPVGRGAVLLGKSLAAFAYSVVSLTSLAVVTSLAFDAQWGPPIPALALIMAMSAALVALTALVIAVSRTERQADGIAMIITFALLLLGGNFVLISQAPEILRRLALLTPNGWTLRGFTDLATGAAATSAVQPVLAILGMAAVVGVLAAAVGRWRAAS
ncbi:ABC-2 type transport system permease protein [Kribbella orskensis]|uniref:ABC-2 type transport system permease protein n=1 Tax=Kribbella orskensis TaxID=2512216 RepID=A0ABY2B6Y3_9ACTN|nr:MULTISPECIES: ABC transporter permease [Kribbella]TCN29620.1 ABC-2 type transport system permease protein [Kribbella sp. VKM Ac-2500]TCO09946.1 ABC-2 type transport system permease protein [Kribbella orskensis]